MSYPHIDLVPINEANQAIAPSNHEADGLTILGLTHSFRLSLPIAKTSRWNGSNFYAFRLRSIVTGIGTALHAWVIYWICSYFLPKWMIWIWIEFRVLGDNRIRIIRTANYIKHFNGSDDWHFWNYAFWLSWVAFLSGVIPNYWKLTVDVAFAPHILSVIAASIQYLESDEPLGWQRISLLAQLDAAIGYCLTSLIFADGAKIFSWLRWISFWLVAVVFDSAALQVDAIKLLRDTYWDTLIQYNRPAAEIVAVVLLIPVPALAYVWLTYMRPNGLADLLRSSSIARWFVRLVDNSFNKLELFDLIGAFAAQQLANHYIHICADTEKLLLDQDTPHYEYRPLEHGYIRLLVVRKTTWRNGFHTELIHRRLAEDLEYEALSYHWGSATLDRSISINGRRMPVTDSAFKLLAARMSYFHERVIWIDAICVNQKDLEEKAVQVPWMSRIYKQAKRVILAPSYDDENRLAASLLYELGTPNNGIGPESLEGRQLHLAMSLQEDRITARWEALVKLLQQPYFTRAWIVQEIAVSKDVLLLLGGIYVPWNIFHEAISKLHNPRFGPLLMPIVKKTGLTGHLALGGIMAIHALRPDSIDGVRGNLVPPDQLNQLAPLLAILTEFKATDQRDKVYAVAGMIAQSQQDIHLDIDYGKDVADVYQDAARAVLLTSQLAIDMLAYAGMGWNRHLCTPHTSWTPVLTIPPNWVAFTDTTMEVRRFQASGTTTAVTQQGQNPQQLQVEGFICDTILELVDVFGIPSNLVEYLSLEDHLVRELYIRLKAAIGSAIDLVRRHRPTITLNELQSALMAEGSPGVDIPADGLSVLWSWLHEVLVILDPDNKNKNNEDAARLWLGVEHLYTFLQYVSRACNTRRFGITAAGRLCIVPPLAEAGDTICIIHGAQTPYVIDNRLLKEKDGNNWVLLGECYVQGIMHGELIDGDHYTTMLTLV